MRNVMRGLVIIGLVAAAASPRAARADDPAAPPAQQASPPAAAQQPTPPGTPQTPSPTQERQSGASEANGIAQMVEEALSSVTLRPDQSDAIQKVGAEVDAKVAAADQAKRDALLALADQIEAGKVDATALKPKTDNYVEAAVAASPTVRKGIEKLHEVLDASQRKQFVSGFRDALKKHAGTFERKARLEEWSSVLGLSDDQKKRIGEILGEDTVGADVARARIELVLAAFPGEHFSIDELLAPPSSVRARVQAMVDRMVDVAGRVTAILTPEQQKTAAAHIRDKVSGKSSGGGGTGQTTSSLEGTGSVSQGIWMGGGGVGYAARYRSYSGFGFGGGGFAAGYGGGYLI
jgi:Spy/CpxP family protein refolding chaperone